MLVRVIKKKKKKRLTALVNREMQIETRARHHPTPSRTARMKRPRRALARTWRKQAFK